MKPLDIEAIKKRDLYFASRNIRSDRDDLNALVAEVERLQGQLKLALQLVEQMRTKREPETIR